MTSNSIPIRTFVKSRSRSTTTFGAWRHKQIRIRAGPYMANASKLRDVVGGAMGRPLSGACAARGMMQATVGCKHRALNMPMRTRANVICALRSSLMARFRPSACVAAEGVQVSAFRRRLALAPPPPPPCLRPPQSSSHHQACRGKRSISIGACAARAVRGPRRLPRDSKKIGGARLGGIGPPAAA